jgi:uncharacterized protein Yka (UPF0111/DUF47 family)
MQAEQMRQCMDRIEQCADDAKRAVKQAANVPEDLKRCVEALHQQASQAKHQPMMDDAMLRETVMQLEEKADEAMRACRAAGDGLDPQVKDAVKRAHAELSRAKHDMQAHA